MEPSDFRSFSVADILGISAKLGHSRAEKIFVGCSGSAGHERRRRAAAGGDARSRLAGHGEECSSGRAVDIASIALLTLVASAVGTLTGFGTSTIMVPVLVSFYPLPQTLLLVGIVHWFGDIWKMLLFLGIGQQAPRAPL